MVSFTLLTFLPTGKKRPYTLDVILGGSHSWTGRCREENITFIDPWFSPYLSYTTSTELSPPLTVLV